MASAVFNSELPAAFAIVIQQYPQLLGFAADGSTRVLCELHVGNTLALQVSRRLISLAVFVEAAGCKDKARDEADDSQESRPRILDENDGDNNQGYAENGPYHYSNYHGVLRFHFGGGNT